jgi:hypothetical protein
MYTVEGDEDDDHGNDGECELKAADIPKSGLNNSLNGVVNLPGCLNAEERVVSSTGKPPSDRRYAQTRVWGQDWTTGDDQREERDGCQHGQRHRSELREMTTGQSQSLLKNILQKEKRRSDVASFSLGPWFCQPRLNTSDQSASRLSRVRHTCSDNRGQLTA